MRSSTTPPDSVQHNVYCALPGGRRRRSLVSAELTNSAAFGPRTNALPRWLTSNSPTVVRVAVCSATVPAYETGIDHPPNSAKLAPSSRWRSSSGPCWMSVTAATLMRAAPGRLIKVDDFDALKAAGIANARDRAGLIKYLDNLGFTVEEMAEAEAR